MPLLSRNRSLPGSLTPSAIDSALCSVGAERSPGAHQSLELLNTNSTLDGLQTLNGETQVFQLGATGDLFPTYEEYLEGASHLREPIWTCRMTGNFNINFYNALKSERESLKMVQNFPIQWAQPVLQIVQGSLDDLEALSRTIAYFCANNFVAGERVRVFLNDESYPAIIQSVIPGKPTFRVLLLSDGNTFFESSSPNGQDTVIGEACIEGMSGISRDPCEQPPPSLSLIRLFIRASASRFGTRKRALWIVNNELLEKYSIDASLSESDSLIIDMARARRIKARKRESLKQKKIIGSSNFAVMPKQPSTSNINIPNNLSKEKLKFPVLDEFVPLEKLAESSPWPVPKSFGQSTIKDQNLIADLLSLWQFFQAFSTNLSLESHSLFSLLSGFELQTHPNAIIESVFTSFLKQFVRIQRSHKRRIKRIALDYLESKLKSNITTQEECLDSEIADDNHNDTNSLRSPSNLPLELKSNGADEVSVRTNEHPESVESNGHAAYRIDNDSQFIQETIKKTKNLSIDRDVDVPRIGKDNEQDRSDSETSSSSPFEYLSKVDWTKDGSKPWYHKVASLLSQLYIIPQIELALLQMSSSKINFYQLPGATKLKVAVVFQELLVTAVSLRSFVEKEVELGSEATQSLRDLELERKRIIKELTELEGLQSQTEDEKSKEIPLKPSSDKIDSNKVNKNIKKLNQLIASLDRQIKKANSNIHMHSAVRIRYLGEDRFYRRYWWPDAHLASSDFPPSNSCGVLLVETSKASQSPYASKCFEPNHYIDLSDKFSVEQKDNTYDVCRVDVVGDGTMQNIQTEIQEMSSRLDNGDEWRLYDSIEEIDSLFAFLSPYGCREAKLGIALSKIRPLLEKNISNAWLKQSKGIKGISLTKSESVKVALSKDNISRRLLIESEESETSHPVSKKSVYLESESADENDERTIGSRRSKRKAELTTSISLEKRTKEVATRKSSRRHPA